MPSWTPEKVWSGRDVYIIGGGKSLKHFDWSLLSDKCTVGCNDAYLLGLGICKICIFGDFKWFKIHEQKLANYKGAVFTNCGQMQRTTIPWLWYLMRIGRGLSHKAIAWNKSTGAAAINLALLLGAKRIFLLGFDMKLSEDGESNWHPNDVDKPDKDVFPEFITGCNNIKKALPKEFPDTEIFNITDNSDLHAFPKIGTKEFWRKQK